MENIPRLYQVIYTNMQQRREFKEKNKLHDG
jgi:hypothetical protein